MPRFVFKTQLFNQLSKEVHPKRKERGECRVAEGCLNVMGGESLSTRESSTKESETESECSDVQM